MLLGVVAAGCGPTGRTDSAPPPRVGVLLASPGRRAKVEGLSAGLAALGLQVRMDVREVGGDRSRLPVAARELVLAGPDVLVAGGNIEAKALVAVTRTIPIVVAGTATPRAAGVVADERRPGGNLTGVDNFHAELTPKRLELFQKLLPGLRRVLLLYDPRVEPSREGLRLAQEVAPRLGLELVARPVAGAGDLERALGGISRAAFDGIVVLPGFVLEEAAPALAAASLASGVPAMGLYPEEAQAGLLASYGVPFEEQGRQAARLVAKVLLGEDPGSIPVETPDRPLFVVNRDVARALGLELSPTGLAFAVPVEGLPVGPFDRTEAGGGGAR
ncbi:ABC transporter substrate-binding protein [Caldinitratiruptor microaerophilus]|uniref:ABC transporter substrate-binding protein n=2 Tax=Caldinitratiruptor microaerophilus TaxID=671077 RepID=A0AA35CMF4_9FIRM|nr:ABC transporter substrate-binding protein [Caldinitratiruptor microaerophilus]